MMKRILRNLAEAWAWLRDLEAVLGPCRFSVVVVIGGAALLLSPQGLELTVRLPTEGWGKAFWFNFCVFLWAFQSWYWARVILYMTFGPDRGAKLAHPRASRIRRFIEWTPRYIAVASYLVAIVASLLAGAGAWKISLALLVEGALFVGGLVWRQEITERLMGKAAKVTGSLKHRVFIERGPDHSKLKCLPRLAKAIMGTTLLAVVGLTGWVWVDAVGFGWTFGAAAVPFLGFSMIAAGGSFLVLLAREGGARHLAAEADHKTTTKRGYPVVTTLLIVAIIFSFCPWLDNHKVRTVPISTLAGTPLEHVLDRWYAQAPRAPGGRANFVVVASAGGGLRAAYWTATVLGNIQDGSEDFRRQLAGISGVSGGSLGAVTFVTLLGQPSLPGSASNCDRGAMKIGAYECAGQAVLSRDFLGPTVAALLFTDLIHRLLPLGFPDRAKALEQSWERAWPRAGFPEGVWRDGSFRGLWSGDRFLPALLLNGTHVESGKRVITSNVTVTASPRVFRNVYDFYDLAPPDSEIRPSTAAHNSARFTYVSPAGTLDDRTHLVDGGYFENFGAVTAREFLWAAINRFSGGIRGIVVLVSNDPELPEDELPSPSPGRTTGAPSQSWAGEVLSPLRALLKTRDARGLLAASELRQSVEELGGRYFQFRLCKDPNRPDPALGWVLSGDAEILMREQLRSSACGNDKQMQLLRDALAGRS